MYNSDDDEDYNTESESDNKSYDEDTNNAHDDESTGSEIPGVEIPGVDNNTQNVNNNPIEIPGVEIPGVDNDNDEKRRYMNMNLRDISRINYKFIHDGKEIPMNDEEEMIFLHIMTRMTSRKISSRNMRQNIFF